MFVDAGGAVVTPAAHQVVHLGSVLRDNQAVHGDGGALLIRGPAEQQLQIVNSSLLFNRAAAGKNTDQA